MAPLTFQVTRSHPLLHWLTAANIRNRAVPETTARNLSRLVTFEQAAEFIKSAGLEIVAGERRVHASANAVPVAPPKLVSSLEGAEYFGPEIVLPAIALREVPFGTVLMNCLLPQIEDQLTAEKIFRAYQEMILSFSQRLDAIPFACITGYKTKMKARPHALYHRGFRFFWSPEPDAFYQRILTSLNAMHDLMSLPREAPQKERHRLIDIIQGSKFCRVGERRVGHALLEDIKFQTEETVLVDLRIS